MKIVVTGGAGFIGSHVADAYVAAGHEVVIVDDLSSGRAEHVNARARFVRLDIRDPGARELIERERPDVLNHHAAQMDVRRSVADPVFDADLNILGFLNLLEGARAAGVRRVIFASSGGAVYGEQDVFPAPESHPTAPVSPYGISKRAGELYLFYYHAQHGLPYVALRYANVYGPRQDPHGEAGVVAIFSERLLRGEQPVINGDGRQTRDYVFVGDVAAANVKALAADFVGPVNVGTAVETDVNRLFGLLRAATGSSATEVHGPGKPGEQRRSVVDPGLAARVLGWTPTVPLEDGLRQAVDFFRGRVAAARGS
jgi:UDP-glucose 4-epimerase